MVDERRNGVNTIASPWGARVLSIRERAGAAPELAVQLSQLLARIRMYASIANWYRRYPKRGYSGHARIEVAESARRHPMTHRTAATTTSGRSIWI